MMMNKLSSQGPPSSSAIVVGTKVRVKADVKEPRFGWGSVKHESVGVVTELRSDGTSCKIDFPKQSGKSAKILLF